MSSELVTVGIFQDTFQASIARNALEEVGIQTFLQGDMSADLFQVRSAMGVRLLVGAANEDEARDILEELEADRERAAKEAVAEGTPESSDVDSAFSEQPIEPGMMAPEPIEMREPTSERAETVGRAIRCAVLGLVFPPLLFLALYFLFLAYGDEEPLEPGVRRQLVITSVVVVPLAVVAACFFGFVCLRVI